MVTLQAHNRLPSTKRKHLPKRSPAKKSKHKPF